jgi:hypothetical protein
MCHLRGLLMLKLNRNDRAKECFLEALALDVKCYDAFEQLVGGELMRPEEGLYFCTIFYILPVLPEGRTNQFLCSRVGVCTELSIQGADAGRC